MPTETLHLPQDLSTHHLRAAVEFVVQEERTAAASWLPEFYADMLERSPQEFGQRACNPNAYLVVRPAEEKNFRLNGRTYGAIEVTTDTEWSPLPGKCRCGQPHQEVTPAEVLASFTVRLKRVLQME